MCDTIVWREKGRVLFGKNSDREAAEPQVVQYFPPVSDDKCEIVKATYIDVPQVRDRNAIIVSKPFWIWGAEMGVNDKGVAIGNEALFSKAAGRQATSLLGMDLLRLALERANSAAEARDVIIALLEEHGQGGPAGYRNKGFKYDNSFLIADAQSAFVLETAGKHWAWKEVDCYYAISNGYTLTTDFDQCSEGVEGFATQYGYQAGSKPFDFRKAFEGALMTRLANAEVRQTANHAQLCTLSPNNSGPADLARILRGHASGEGFQSGRNGDVCMHAGGINRPSQSTGSMICELSLNEPPRIYFTGSSATCLSLFKPTSFDRDQDYLVETPVGDELKSLWHRFEPIHRHAIFDSQFREILQTSLAAPEQRVFSDSCVKGDDIARGWLDEIESLLPGRKWRADPSFFGIFWWLQRFRDGL